MAPGGGGGICAPLGACFSSNSYFMSKTLCKKTNNSILFCFNFQGGVILVSHDERLIQLVCQELWVVRDGKVISLEGGFTEYKKIVEEELAALGL